MECADQRNTSITTILRTVQSVPGGRGHAENLLTATLNEMRYCSQAYYKVSPPETSAERFLPVPLSHQMILSNEEQNNVSLSPIPTRVVQMKSYILGLCRDVCHFSRNMPGCMPFYREHAIFGIISPGMSHIPKTSPAIPPACTSPVPTHKYRSKRKRLLSICPVPPTFFEALTIVRYA